MLLSLDNKKEIMKNIIEPLVTIVTITYNLKKNNREVFFRQCVESVRNQNYKNIEHLVIDGASKDGTIDLIKEYADMGWVKFFSESDRGVYDAMNKGLARAEGKYITFLNSDDYYQNSDAVGISVNALESTGSDYSFADTQGINAENNKPLDIWKGNISRLPFGNHYCHQSMFIKTDVLRELGGFDTSYRVSADSELMVKLASLNKKHVYIPQCIVSYRSGGLSNKHILETRKEHSEVFYKFLGKKEGLSAKDCYLLWNFSILNEKTIEDCIGFRKKIKRKEWKKEYTRRLFGFDNIKNKIKGRIPKILLGPLTTLYRFFRKKP